VRVGATDSAGNLVLVEAEVRVPRKAGAGGCGGPLPPDSFVGDDDPVCSP
jgi:hypothetical protein